MKLPTFYLFQKVHSMCFQCLPVQLQSAEHFLTLSFHFHSLFITRFPLFICRLSGFNWAHYLKGDISSCLAGVCDSATFDVDNASRRKLPDESCILSDGEAVGDLLVDRQGRDPNESQIVIENQSSVGGEDECADHERSSAEVEYAAADLKGDEKELEADVVEGLQEIPVSLEDDLVEGREEAQTLQRNDPEFDDLSEGLRSARTPSEPTNTASDESSIKAGAGHPDDPLPSADDVGTLTLAQGEGVEEAVERTELRDEAAEDGNAEMSRSAEPELDSAFTPSKQPQSHRARKQERRYLSFLKVLQTVAL